MALRFLAIRSTWPEHLFGKFASTYNATTGATINANFIAMTGAQGVTISGNNSYATSLFGTVNEFNATTGAAVAGFTPLNISDRRMRRLSGATNSFCLGQQHWHGRRYTTPRRASRSTPISSPDSTIPGVLPSRAWICSWRIGGSTISEYNALTGALISANFRHRRSRSDRHCDFGQQPRPSAASLTWCMTSLMTGALMTSGFTSPSGLNNGQSIALAPAPRNLGRRGHNRQRDHQRRFRNLEQLHDQLHEQHAALPMPYGRTASPYFRCAIGCGLAASTATLSGAINFCGPPLFRRLLHDRFRWKPRHELHRHRNRQSE